METTTRPETNSSPEIPLTRQEKEKLLQKMYSSAHWIAVIRLFGYKTIPMNRAREEIKPIAEEFGKELVANACEALVEINTQDKEAFARLKPHVRRMAFQILGPEPTPDAIAPTGNSSPLAPAPQPEAEPPRKTAKRKTKKAGERSAPPPQPPTAVDASPMPSDSRSAIMQQYYAAKERHPNMLLLFRNVAK